MLHRIFQRFSSKTVFDRILSKELPSKMVYEDEHVYAFKDINPVAPVHIVVIPKNKDGLTGISKAQNKHVDIIGRLMVASANIANSNEDLKNGYRLVINEGKWAGQSVDHLHVHILGGRMMTWPPG